MKNNIMKKLSKGIVIYAILSPFIALIIGSETYDSMIPLMVFISCIPAWIYIIYIIRNDIKAIPDEIGKTNLNRFFVECVLSGCNDFTVEKNVAKAEALADKYHLYSSDGIQSVYKNALKEYEENLIKRKKHNEENELLRLKQREKTEYDSLNRYSQFYGRTKKIAMINDIINVLNKQQKEADATFAAWYRSDKIGEGDAALFGGIANAIAGPVAAMETVMNIEEENARRNEKNRVAKNYFMSSSARASLEIGSEIGKWKDIIEVTKEKIVSDIPADDVMESVIVKETNIEVSETGAIKISATVQAKETLYIFGDVTAVVDGTIIAHIFEDGKEIGTANMVLPMDGVSGKKVKVSGIMLKGANKNKKHKVTFTAGKLWLMEK